MLMVNQLTGFGGARRESLIDASGLSYVGTMTGNGGLSAAFDNNNDQAVAASARKASSPGTVGVDFGAGNTRRVTRAVAYAPNDAKIGDAGTSEATLTLYGTTDGTASGGTQLAQVVDASPGVGESYEFTIDSPGNYRGYYLHIALATGTDDPSCAEVELYEEL